MELDANFPGDPLATDPGMTELAESSLSLLAEAIAQRDESDAVIRDLLGAFERELSTGHTTYAQQYCLRRAREVIASHGNAEAKSP